MALNEKEKTTIKDLQTQEQTCINKYKKYGQDAKDPVLKELFSTLEKNEHRLPPCFNRSSSIANPFWIYS